MLYWFICIGLICVLHSVRKYVRHRRCAARLAHLPGITQFVVPLFPLPGWLRRLLGVQMDFLDSEHPVFAVAHELHRKHGPIFKAIIGIHADVFIADPELLKEAFLSKPKIYAKPVDEYKPVNIFGPNILSSDGDEWHRHRRAAQAAFSERNIAAVNESSLAIADTLIASWAQQTKGEFEIDPSQDLTKVATAVITGAGFGLDLNVFAAPVTPPGHALPMVDVLTGVFRTVFARVLLYGLTPTWLQRLFAGILSRIPTLALPAKEFTRYMEEMMVENADSGDRGDLISLLVRARHSDSDVNRLTNREVQSDGLMFLFAGQETTATALGWALHLLALHPEKQTKLRDAVQRFLAERPEGTSENEHFARNGDSLEYVEWVVREALRIHPPVPLLSKIATKDDRLGPAGVVIPEGTKLVASFYTLQRSVPNGDAFLPERWAGQKVTGHASFSPAWTPFSLGPRNCIGYRFAMTEMQALLAKLVTRYRFESAVQPKPTVTVTMQPKGLRLRVIPI